MADRQIPALSRAREQKISELSTHFANDDITLEDLERRIERVYKAANVAELDSITSDLRSVVAASSPQGRGEIAPFGRKDVAPPMYERARDRILAIMSSTRRMGRWAVPRNLDILAVMSDTKIDLTHAVLPPGVVDVDVHAVMAAFKLIVPPNVQVINEMHSFMADVRSRAHEIAPAGVPARADTTIIRLTGVAFMADVKVVVRHREDLGFEDDDDDED
jgi:hypothetical protein